MIPGWSVHYTADLMEYRVFAPDGRSVRVSALELNLSESSVLRAQGAIPIAAEKLATEELETRARAALALYRTDPPI